MKKLIEKLELEFAKRFNLYKDDRGLWSSDCNVTLYDLSLTRLPLKFGHIRGDFDCSENNLTTLWGAPHTIDGDFWCYENLLTNLQGGPEIVGGNYWCNTNELTSLEGVKLITTNFWCHRNLNILQKPETLKCKMFINRQ